MVQKQEYLNFTQSVELYLLPLRLYILFTLVVIEFEIVPDTDIIKDGNISKTDTGTEEFRQDRTMTVTTSSSMD